MVRYLPIHYYSDPGGDDYIMDLNEPRVLGISTHVNSGAAVIGAAKSMNNSPMTKTELHQAFTPIQMN